MRRQPAMDEWIILRPPELGAIARRWFAEMRWCGDNVTPETESPSWCP